MTKSKTNDSQQGIVLKVPLHESNSIEIKLNGPLFRNSVDRLYKSECSCYRENAAESRCDCSDQEFNDGEGASNGCRLSKDSVSCLQRLQAWFRFAKVRAIAAVTAVAIGSFALGLLAAGGHIPFNEDAGNGPLPIVETDRSTEESIRKDSMRIANSIMDGKMTREKANELLSALDVLGSMTESVPPDSELQNIPEDTMKILAEFGLIDTLVQPEGNPKTEDPMIDRIPSEIRDRYRDENGIPSIPDRNYWKLTGDRINLPLPGGGNAESAEEFKEFGLNF